MKHIRSYNESIKDYLKPKSVKDIEKSIKHLSNKDKFKNACKYHLTWLVERMVKNGFDPSFDNNLCLINCGVLKYDDIVDILMKNDKVIKQLYKSQLDTYIKDNDGNYYNGDEEYGDENDEGIYVDWYLDSEREEDGSYYDGDEE